MENPTTQSSAQVSYQGLSNIDVSRQIRNLRTIQRALTLAGGVSGILVAINMNTGFWKGAGLFLLGSAMAGIPASIIISRKISKLTNE
jgi:hypothetical protein